LGGLKEASVGIRLNDIALIAAEASRVGLDGLYWSGWLAVVEAPGFAVGFVEQREGLENAVIREKSPSEDHAVGAHKAIGSDQYRFTVLWVVLDVDGVAQKLGVITGNGIEGEIEMRLVQSILRLLVIAARSPSRSSGRRNRWWAKWGEQVPVANPVIRLERPT
jgi:hypothetical protein